jgi:hypothetical protein
VKPAVKETLRYVGIIVGAIAIVLIVFTGQMFIARAFREKPKELRCGYTYDDAGHHRGYECRYVDAD